MASTGITAKRRAFLAAYIELGGNIDRASKAANCDRREHYHCLVHNPEYAAAFAAARDQAAQQLEDEAIRRAYEGWGEPVIYQGAMSYEPKVDKNGNIVLDKNGKMVLTDKPLLVRKYSDRLLEFLLKGVRPDKYRDNAKIELSGSVDLVERLAAARKRLNPDE